MNELESLKLDKRAWLLKLRDRDELKEEVDYYKILVDNYKNMVEKTKQEVDRYTSLYDQTDKVGERLAPLYRKVFDKKPLNSYPPCSSDKRLISSYCI